MRVKAVAYLAANKYKVEHVLEVLQKLSGATNIRDGMRIVISGYPADLYDCHQDGTIDLEAVDEDAYKGIKGALMKEGITTKRGNGLIQYISLSTEE